MDNKYKKLMTFFENVKLDYSNQSNSSLYINTILNVRNYIDNIKYTLYKSLPNKVPNFTSKEKKELYRSISTRQSFCIFKCIQYIYDKKFTDALNELIDAIEDYENHKERNIISINECFLFSEVLNIFYDQLLKNQNSTKKDF